MGNEVMWPGLCLVVGLILLIAEVFIPSGGFIGLLAVGLIAVSLYLSFASSTALGLKFLIAISVLLPLTLIVAVQLWPRTPMAKFLFLKPPDAEDFRPEPLKVPLSHLIGQFGRSLTPLRPSGVVDFEGQRLDALCDEGLIAANRLVRAVAVRGSQIVVRLAPDRAIVDLESDTLWPEDESSQSPLT